MADDKENTGATLKPESPDRPVSGRKSAKSAKSASSGKSTARSQGSAKGSGSAKGKKGGKGKKGKKKEEDRETPAPPDDDATLPEGVIPIFLASKTQEIFEVRCDEDVTVESPNKFIKKEDILADMYNRAAVCDFTVFKQQIQDYPGEEFLLVYDSEFKFGQNFYIALTEEGKEKLLHPEGEEGEDKPPEEDIVYTYIPPVPKDWVNLGSDAEIAQESLKNTRPTLKIQVRRKRRHFGAHVEFTDRNVADAKDCYVGCEQFEDKAFDLKRVELTKGIQAIPEFVDSAAQTDWKYPRNAGIQYEAREFDEAKKEEIIKKPELLEVAKYVVPRFKLALQQNEIMDVFYDDWAMLGDDDSSFGSKADNHLKEYQSFTDLKFSKDKTITAIDWHPTIRGIVAVSIGEKLSFDEKLDHAQKIIMNPSLILVWSFADPIHPQLLLEAPDDILSFQFNPTDSNMIAGGCVNGQVVLWDISQHVERLKQPRGNSKKKNNLHSLNPEEQKESKEENTGQRVQRKSKWGIDEKKMAFAEFDGRKPGFEDENSLDTPIVRYCAVSSIENSHHAPITDLQWVPDHFEVSRMGVPHENRSGQCAQILTCAGDHPSASRRGTSAGGEDAAKTGKDAKDITAVTDSTHGDDLRDEQVERMSGTVFFWDTRPPKTAAHLDKRKDEQPNPMGVPDTFKHLDLTWKPHLKVSLSKSEPGGDHSPIKFSIQEKQGDKSILSKQGDEKVEKKPSDTMTGGFSFGAPKPGSASKRPLPHMNTHFYVGTEDGEVVYVDWMPQKDQDSGKIQTPKPDYYHTMHDGGVVTLQRSPFFNDILLCVGGWSFTVWKEGVSSGPILQSCPSNKRLTAGHWSSSRPAVFYIARQDGSVDIWDLLDRTHEPSMNQSVTSAPITAIFPYEVTSKQHLLGVGDQTGTLHILEIPWSLRQPTANELTGMNNYFEREVKRRTFVMARWDFREKEKMELENEKKMKAGIAPNVVLSEEELVYKQKNEYQAYLDEESAFLRELGLKEEVEEPLPEVE